ncbi:MAG: VWA domain-containing protein [Bacteroidetes bacterium]|nr:VWA domain-containing protein [Bacteroidota bacterium]MDA0922701.1 VWA domain-containing protein [Bacteroidota bacterium]MDA1288938.1 VWA domain-containing protein [Bacteroidota bacterium]
MNWKKFPTGLKFVKPIPKDQTPFEKLLEIFKELITHTSGDFEEAIDWLRELDKEYELTDENYTIDDFIEELKQRAFIQPKKGNGTKGEGYALTPKTEKLLREHALKQIFGKLKKTGAGNHKTQKTGQGQEATGEFKAYQFGDSIDKIAVTESLKNAQIRSLGDDFTIQDQDLVVEDAFYKTQMSTVLMIDISHSMILYGEDRITPAKKVAMALAELITTRYPKDTLDILVFGNDAMPIAVKDIPYLEVGPYHTNTVAGLELAMDLLRRKKNTNKQIFMITDGKPSCLKLADGSYYKNSVGLDETIVEKCYTMARQAKKLHIPITTFMIAQDPYLQQFIRTFTEANQGKAFFTGLKGLGEMIFEDYEKNRKKRLD